MLSVHTSGHLSISITACCPSVFCCYSRVSEPVIYDKEVWRGLFWLVVWRLRGTRLVAVSGEDLLAGGDSADAHD